MSLINKMLQDLDARRAAYGFGTALPNDVRPLPVPQTSHLPIIMGGIMLLVLAGGVVFYLEDTRQESAPLAQNAIALPPPIIPPAAEAEIRVQPESLPVEQQASVGPSFLALDPGLHIADSVQPALEKKGEAKPAHSSTAAHPVVTPAVAAVREKSVAANKQPVSNSRKAVAAEQQSPPRVPAVVQGADKPAKTPKIERTDSVGTPRDRAETDYRKAIAAVNQGRVAEALEGLRNALRQDELHVASRQLLVKLLLEARQPDEAIQVLHDGLQGQPAQTGWAINLARLQVDRGDLAGAWQTLDYSLPAAGGNADYQGFAAHVLQRLGRNREAIERYQAASRLSPADGRWWLGLGLVLDAEGRSAEAREAYIRARQSGNLNAELMAMIEQKLR